MQAGGSPPLNKCSTLRRFPFGRWLVRIRGLVRPYFPLVRYFLSAGRIIFLLITPHSLQNGKKEIASFTVSWRSRYRGLRRLRRSFALSFLLSPALDLLRAPRGRSIRGHDRQPTYQVRFSPCP